MMGVSEISIPYYTLPLFFIVAWLYSSVGHGGASGYQAIFALIGVAGPAFVPVALLLNILVSTMSFANFRHNGYFRYDILLPFVITSIPASYAAAVLGIGREFFAFLLGAALLSSAWRLLVAGKKYNRATAVPGQKTLWLLALPLGLLLGALSGIIGIGGGVFLSPLLLFFRWTDIKQTAAVSAAFIALNSISGLAGHLGSKVAFSVNMLPLLIAVLAGGWLGSRAGAGQLQPQAIRFILAAVLVLAGGKLIAVSI